MAANLKKVKEKSGSCFCKKINCAAKSKKWLNLIIKMYPLGFELICITSQDYLLA